MDAWCLFVASELTFSLLSSFKNSVNNDQCSSCSEIILRIDVINIYSKYLTLIVHGQYIVNILHSPYST